MKKLSIFEMGAIATSGSTEEKSKVENFETIELIAESLGVEGQELSNLVNGSGDIVLSTSQLSTLSETDIQILYAQFVSSEKASSFQTFENILTAMSNR